MSFLESQNRLQSFFNKKNFTQEVINGRKHTSAVIVKRCNNGTIISISFPGYKALINKNNKTIYDYRVDIKKDGITTALSHTNIIADIFNKIVFGKMSGEALQSALIQLAKSGTINISEIKHQLNYVSCKPLPSYLSRIKKSHGKKYYNQIGNSFDLTLEELFFSIKWIVLQEDINYPMPRYQGRKMPFARYLETIFICQNTSHNLEEVITRTLSHKKPTQWSEMDYSFLNEIS